MVGDKVDVKMYSPSYTNLNIANMNFVEYLEFAKEAGILQDKQDKLTKWQIEAMNRKFKNPVLKEAQRLIYRENRNAIIFVMGKVGSGKSYISLKLAELFDPTFKKNIWNRVIYDKGTFFFRLLDPHYPLMKGNVLIMEELGTQMDSRNWFDFAQKAFNYIMQTFRYRNLLIIFNAPRIKEIDNRLLGYINIIIDAKPVDRTKEYWKDKNLWKAYKVEENQVKSIVRGSPAYYLKRFTDENGRVIEHIITRAPSREVIEYYEAMSREWKLKFNYELAKDVASRYLSEDTGGKINSILQEIEKNISKYTKERGGELILLDEVVRHDFKLTSKEVKYIKQMFELRMREKKNIVKLESLRGDIDKPPSSGKDEIEDLLEMLVS